MIDQREITGKQGPRRILAVDDNAAALYATSRVLRSAGYEVIEAKTGAAALEMAARADLVVLDVNLPDMDGFEVCRRLRANPQTAQIPVLHLSATFTNAADYALGFEAGADSYLTRPVEPPVLVATVRTLLFARHADILRRGLDARMRTMFNLVPVAIAILDDSLKILSVNPAYC
jgi:DNA-binding response OmpR family regulator